MSSVPLPNNSDTDRSAVDLNSKQSGDGTEGTGDHLNEAPRCSECGYTDADARFHMDHQLCKNYPFFTEPGGYEVGCVKKCRGCGYPIHPSCDWCAECLCEDDGA